MIVTDLNLHTSPLARILLSTSPPQTKIRPEIMAIPGKIRPISMEATLNKKMLKFVHKAGWH